MNEIVSSLLTAFGGVALVTALSAWLGKIWASRILESDRVRYQTQMETLLVELRTLSDKEIFVHRLQFEKEFEVYSSLWKELLELARAMSPFRVIATNKGKSREQLVQEFVSTHDAFMNRLYLFRPFYSPEIYTLGKRVLDNAFCVSQYLHNDRPSPEDVKKAEQAQTDLNEQCIPAICDAIRNRIFPARLNRTA